jgi:ATP synthase I chain
MDWKNLQKRLRLLNWVILLILSSTSALLMRYSFAGGVLLGGLIAISNFHVLQHTIRGAFLSDGNMRKGKFSIIIKSYLRLFVLGVIIYILIDKGLVDPIGLAVGVSTILFSIVSLGISLVMKTKTGEAV